jgi:hypothetical protein
MMERFQRDDPGGRTAAPERFVADARDTAETTTGMATGPIGVGGEHYHRRVDRAGFSE